MYNYYAIGAYVLASIVVFWLFYTKRHFVNEVTQYVVFLFLAALCYWNWDAVVLEPLLISILLIMGCYSSYVLVRETQNRKGLKNVFFALVHGVGGVFMLLSTLFIASTAVGATAGGSGFFVGVLMLLAAWLNFLRANVLGKSAGERTFWLVFTLTFFVALFFRGWGVELSYLMRQ